ncbi:hypothetical protein L3Q82_018322, partial [Scortum barcoo]
GEVCIVRESCILPCIFPPGDELVLHWIQLKGGDTFVHTYYHNQDQLAHQSQQFRGRTSLFKDQIRKGNVSLLLRGVQFQDQGQYKCYTSTISGNKESFVNLDVEAPVGEVDIQQVGNRITCSSEGIYPEPELTWSTSPPSNVNLESTTTVQQTEQQLYNISSSLIVSDSVTDLVYSCTVSTRTNSRRATLKFSSVSGCGTETTIPCTSSNTTLTKLIWRFNHSQIILNQTRTDRTVSEEWRQQVKDVSESGKLTLQELSSNQEGIYTCELRNEEETDVTITNLKISKDCSTPSSQSNVAGIVVGVILFVVLVVGLFFYRYKMKSKKKQKADIHTEEAVNLNLEKVINIFVTFGLDYCTFYSGMNRKLRPFQSTEQHQQREVISRMTGIKCFVFVVVLTFQQGLIRGDIEVSCAPMGSCILPCSFNNNDSVLIHWTTKDIYVHSYYNNSDQLKHQEQRFRGRTSLFKEQISRGNASLQLTEVEVQDEGRYQCYISTDTATSSYINLKVDASIFSVCGTETTIPCTSSNTTLTKLIWRFNHSQIILIQTRTDRTVSEEWRQQLRNEEETKITNTFLRTDNCQRISTSVVGFIIGVVAASVIVGAVLVLVGLVIYRKKTRGEMNLKIQVKHNMKNKSLFSREQQGKTNMDKKDIELGNKDETKPDADVFCVFGKSCILPCSFQGGTDVVLHWINDMGNTIVHSYYNNRDQLAQTRSSRVIYPEPELTWSTSPPSNVTFNNTATVQQTEQQLYNISSSLIVSDSVTDLVYSCTVSTRTNSRRATLKFYVCGTETTIPCTSSNTTLTKLIWRFNHSQIILIQTRTDRTVSEEWRQQVKDVSESGKLTLQELSSNQEGIYTCELRNEEETKITNIFLRTDNCQDAELFCVFGKSCILPCSFQGGTDSTIDWVKIKGDTDVHTNVHHYNNNRDQLAHQEQRFRGRTSLFKEQISRGNASLQLTEVEVQDQGRYECHTSSISSKKESFINVTVDVNPLVQNIKIFCFSVPVGEVNIQQVGNRITCSSEGIYPEPELTWSTSPPSNVTFNNTATVQQTEQQLYNISSSLIVSDSVTDLVYSCTVSTRTNSRRTTLKFTSICQCLWH